eukprot:735542-Heterocapsa_arctica.AAC.1
MRHGRLDVFVFHLGPLPTGRVIAPDRLGVAQERVERFRAIELRGRDIDGAVVAVPAGVREPAFTLSVVIVRAAPRLDFSLATALARALGAAL